ncbi:MAG TPA: transglycosylase domain-containing protein [Streptosporangiaceae bacterium]|jgi:membrane peptidoglycan carboxypeptidase
MTTVAALLVAAVTVPLVGIVGIATKDVADTFNSLPVGTLGTAPVRSVVYDAEGHVLTYLYPNSIYRVPVDYDQIAPVMRDAIVAIEDKSFYNQGALDPRGTLRALVNNSGGGSLQGASTLAQQYVKNVRVLQAGTNQSAVDAAVYPDLQRKVQDLRVAVDVEHEMSQQQLLAGYLNVAYFDNNAWGIQVAAQVYFSKSASQLTLPEAALLAGLVQSPTTYDPFTNVAAATARRNTVLTDMSEQHYVSKADALAAEKTPLDTRRSGVPGSGCRGMSALATSAGAGFFCDYVEHVLEMSYPSVWNEINTTGGLAIHTTLNLQDQRAANAAVRYVQPNHNGTYNPGGNADTEVLLKPGTGALDAIAIDRNYGQDDIDYAVTAPYGGGAGVQTGSSSKLFTLITALEQGLPFGHTLKVSAPTTAGPYTNCQGGYVAPATFNNSEGPSKGTETWQMNQATVDSINVFFVNLEKQVGLCNVVKTAVRMGLTRADGTSLLKPDRRLGRNGISADNLPGFTLGEVNVAPMGMAAAYASVAAGGIYCSPEAITGITVEASGAHVPVQKRSCYRDMSSGVAAAASYILQGVMTVPGATAFGRNDGVNHHVAGKTGTADNGFYAAFAGYSPTLAGYVSVFNPTNPTGAGAMVGSGACYRDVGQTGASCVGQMFGDNAPAATWQYTFQRANLGPDIPFAQPPASFFSQGNGLGAPKVQGKGGGGKHGKHGGPLPPVVGPSPPAKQPGT